LQSGRQAKQKKEYKNFLEIQLPLFKINQVASNQVLQPLAGGQ
jgi:hypothetical protein